MTFSFNDALIDASDWGTNLIKIISWVSQNDKVNQEIIWFDHNWNRMNKVMQLIVVSASTGARVLHLFIVISLPPVFFSPSCKFSPYYTVSSAPPNRVWTEILCWDVAATVDLFLICLLHIVGSQVVNCKCWPFPFHLVVLFLLLFIIVQHIQ